MWLSLWLADGQGNLVVFICKIARIELDISAFAKTGGSRDKMQMSPVIIHPGCTFLCKRCFDIVQLSVTRLSGNFALR